MAVNEVWEILVPATWNDGTPVKVRHHRVWDEFVKHNTGGITIMRPAKGAWRKGDKEFIDRMIPVRFIATSRRMVNEIMKFTAEHYDQEAVMCYFIAAEVIVATRAELGVTKPFWRKTNGNE